MAARHQLHALKNHPNLQRFLIANARPTGRQLGTGSYGSVEELEVSGVMCAGKKIHESLIEQGNYGAENIASKYVEECQLMSDLRHPHLVQFLGVCFLPNSSLPVLVMERLLTSLDELLEHNSDIPLSLKRSILVDVARGLVYLHSRNPPVIHRDLSARNVLLNSAMVAKITDLGNARIVNFKPGQLARTLSRIPGTMVYMPPEAFEETSKYGTSLDCFSFGHLSLFTISQVFPGTLLHYNYRDPKKPRQLLARTELQRRDEFIKLLHQQLGERHPLVLLVKQCLDDEPSKRPSAQELLRQLEGMSDQVVDPYQHLNKLEVMRLLNEKETQVEALSASRQELVALQTQMEQLQLEHSSQITAKDDEIFRLGEKMKTVKLKYVTQLHEKDSQLAAKDDENSKLLSSMKAVIEARENRILELVAQNEQKEAEMHRLMAELRDLHSKQQKAPVTPDLPSEPDERLTGDASSPMPSPATASVTHTEPGGDSQVKKKPHVISESALSAAIPIHELPRHIQPSPKAVEKNTTAVDQSEAVEKNTTAVDQSEGLQNMSAVIEARESRIEETEAEIHTELPPVKQDLPFKPDERLTWNASASTTSTAASSVTHTGPGDDSPVEELHEDLPGSASSEAYPFPSPATKAAEKKTSAVDHPWQAEGQPEVWAPGTEVVGMYDFPGSAAYDLPFKRGDILTIICRSEDPNWYEAKRYDGKDGMIPYMEGKIPYNYVQKLRQATDDQRQAVQLQSMPWFHGDIGRERTQQLLKPFKNGQFLLRESENYKGDHILCVSYGEMIEHYLVRRNDNGWVTIDDEEYFENLVKLVEHYQKDADGLCCRLKHPVKKTSDYIEYTVSVQDFKERGWDIPRRSIITKNLIGKGSFKGVFLGEYQGQKVAMTMTTYTEDKKVSQQLLVEAAIMTALRHPNLVSLIGVCLDEPPLCLITEYMAKGSLLEYLRSWGRAVISQQDQLGFASDVCKGMVYLEAQNLVHRNLAATNVLIGADNTAKVSGFRLTREKQFMTEQVIKLMVQWTAPEALREKKFSSKSDVWSFGILLWEIYSCGKPPYPHVPIEEVVEHVAAGNRLSAPEGCPAGAYQITKECWDEDASL